MYVVLFLSINVLYYVMVHVLCWTPGRVAAAFATANGDPNTILMLVCVCVHTDACPPVLIPVSLSIWSIDTV